MSDEAVELPELEEGQYPPFVETEAERLRWRTAVGVARQLFDDDANVWQAARSLYQNDQIED